jgi:hypothetical protein
MKSRMSESQKKALVLLQNVRLSNEQESTESCCAHSQWNTAEGDWRLVPLFNCAFIPAVQVAWASGNEAGLLRRISLLTSLTGL